MIGNNRAKIFSSDIFRFLLLLAVTLALKKVSPSIIFSGFLFFTLFLFYKSKKNWFYILYAVILTYDVGGLIGFGGYNIINTGFLIIKYFEIFSIVAFVKAINKKPDYFFNRGVIKIWLFYGVFLSIYGLIFFGVKDFGGNTGFRYFWYLFRLVISLLFIYSLPRLLKDYEDVIKFSEMLFFLVFVNFAGQLFYLFAGKPLFFFISGVTGGDSSFIRTLGLNIFENGYTMRPEYGSNIRFYAIFLATYFYYIKDKTFNKTYLLIVIFTILISTFITATRGWILSFSFYLLLSTILSQRGANYIKIFVIGFFLSSLALSISPIIKYQVGKSFERFTTLEKLADGDVTAGGTNVRLTKRSVPVMLVFYEYPFVGVGISGLGMVTSDHHVGNQTMLMGEGIIGMLIFIGFIISFILGIYKYNKKLYQCRTGYQGSLILIIFSFLSLLIIHSSSQGLFGWLVYAVHPEKILFISLLFVIYNSVLIENLKLYGRKNK